MNRRLVLLPFATMLAALDPRAMEILASKIGSAPEPEPEPPAPEAPSEVDVVTAQPVRQPKREELRRMRQQARRAAKQQK